MGAETESSDERGLTIVFTGEGKGKTSAALGIVLRASGYGMRTCIIQFIKGNAYSGEIDGVERLHPDVELYRAGKGFIFTPDAPDYEIHRAAAREALRLAEEKVTSGGYDIVVLDEIHNAIKVGLVELSQVLGLLERKPPSLHLILTGRDAHPTIIERADTVTEMKEIRHAFQQGMKPRKGIDF